MSKKYFLIDSGGGKKLEQWGEFSIIRPCSQALWSPFLSKNIWDEADCEFTRKEDNVWVNKKNLPKSWNVDVEDIILKVSPTDFGHMGAFPEHALLWKWMRNKKIKNKNKNKFKILNLFAYSGGATIAALKENAQVCHVDASFPSVEWAKANVAFNGMDNKKNIRWIVDDVFKFLKREFKRKSFYHGIILDPPSFGRGTKNEVFKIEKDIQKLLLLCKQVLVKESPLFFIFSCHTPGITPLVMDNLMHQNLSDINGKINSSEMTIFSKNSKNLPCGCSSIWESFDD